MRRLVATGLLSAFMIEGCSEPPGQRAAPDMAPAPAPEIVSARTAITSAAILTIDPESLYLAEIDKVVPSGQRCTFAYTAEGRPIFAGAVAGDGRGARGVVKIHGRLVELTAPAADFAAITQKVTFAADGLSLTVAPRSEGGEPVSGGLQRWNAELAFEVGEELKVGYGGWYRCDETQ